MNTELMQQILDQITTFPTTYSQVEFLTDVDENVYLLSDEETLGKVAELRTNPVCGTTACIAGWATILSRKLTGRYWVDNGREALELSSKQADWLFSVGRSDDEMPYILKDLIAGRPWKEVMEEYQ